MCDFTKETKEYLPNDDISGGDFWEEKKEMFWVPRSHW